MSLRPEQSTLGSFLRSLRASRRLGLSATAQAAGVHRTTLHRWEKGEALPRLAELEAFLSALKADPNQKRQAMLRLDTPSANSQVREEIVRIGERVGIGRMSHGGDLLRALRIRQRLSLEEAACRMQITSGTLRRWEKMEVWPSPEQLHRLCYTLDAREEEIVALTVGRFSQKSRLEKTSIEALQARLFDLRVLESSLPGGYPLFELTYLLLEADAWPLALRSAAGKQMLINIYAHHAQSLSSREQLTEAGLIVERVLELMTDQLKPAFSWMYPVFISARLSVYRGAHPAPQRGLEILRPWHSVAQWPAMQAWLLADMAKYLGMSGEPEVALTLMEQACQVAKSTGREVEVSLRQWDKASLLLQAGRPQEALALVEERSEPEDQPHSRIDVSLLRAESYLGMGERTQASHWLQRAQIDIDTYHIEYKRPHAEKLAAQL